MSRFKGMYILIMVMILPVFLVAQFRHFVYLQSENKQPFYVKLDKRILSSSATGYLIIPKLNDGVYNIAVGFPKDDSKEQLYTIRVAEKDAGYLLKNFGDKGWGLFNMQTLDVTMSGSKAEKNEMPATEKTDAFSSMLADAVNDPSIKQPEKKPAREDETKQAENPRLVQKALRSVIHRQSNISKSDGIEITYIDVNGNGQDTIQVFIPSEKK